MGKAFKTWMVITSTLIMVALFYISYVLYCFLTGGVGMYPAFSH